MRAMNNKIFEEDIRYFADSFELYDNLRGKVFLITGATGLIGSVMIKCLLGLNRKYGLGIKILAIIRDLDKARRIFDADFPEIIFLLTPLKEISADRIGGNIDFIIHLASPTASRYFVDNPVETIETSFFGTQSILALARDINAEAVVFASSMEVYGINEDDRLIDEQFQGYVNPLEIRSSYNMGKRVAESLCHAYVKEYGVNVKIARLTQTTGAGVLADDNRVIVQFARLAAKGADIVLHTSGEAARPILYTTDAISALLYVLLKGEKGEAYNVANSDSYMSVRDLAYFIRDNFNRSIKVVIQPAEGFGYAPVTKLRLDTSKLQSLGWKPRYGLNDMFGRLLSFLQD